MAIPTKLELFVSYTILQDGESPIMVAAKVEQTEVVELLKNQYQQPEPSPADLKEAVRKSIVLANMT